MQNVKVQAVAWSGGLESPQYQVPYTGSGNTTQALAQGWRIVGALAAGRDLVIELVDSLLCAPERDRASVGQAFWKAMQARGLTVTERRFPRGVKPSFFSRILGAPANNEICEYRALVPRAVWEQADFVQALQAYGLRYYVLPEGLDGSLILERLNKGTIKSEEIIETMDMIIYDVPLFGQMGIIAPRSSAEGLQQRIDTALV